MTVRDVGDGYPIEYQARDPDGVLTAATMALTVTDPSGNDTTPSPTNPSTGIYRYTIDLDEAGLWRWVWWAVTGAVEDKAYGEVLAADPAPGLYAEVPDLRRELGIADGGSDDQLASALASVSREIDEYCSVPPGAFRPSSTATARVFEPRDPCLVTVDPFYTDTGLVVKTDDAGDGTYTTTWAASDFQLEPLNAVAYGKPYTSVRAVNRRFPCWWARAPIQITAKWGWPVTPDPVRQACLLLAAETMKLGEAPFGVAAYDQFGPIRVRQNPVAMAKLGPYQRYPVLIG
jgi:hypothetical protein